MWTVLLSIRYFLAKRKHGIISFINWTSIIGVALGVASLIIVISVMNGFDKEVRSKIIGTYAHIMVLKDGGIDDTENVQNVINTIPDIKSSAGFVTGQAVLRKDKRVAGLLLKGIDPEKEATVSDVLSFIDIEMSEFTTGSIMLGRELMIDVGISVGDTIEIIVPYSVLDMKKVKLTVAGEFVSGRYDYDANIGIININDAKELYKLGDNVTGVAVRIYDGANVLKVSSALRSTLGHSYVVKSWMDMDRNLVAALALEKKMMYLVLGIIVVVACFNICSSLIMMVMEKTRDIGILKAIGANSYGISSVFLLEGFFVGVLGVTLGGAAGVYIANRINVILGFVEKITGYELFPSDVYYFSELPVLISSNDVCVITISALLLALVSGIYPAWKASRLDPVEAIRYE